MQGMRGLVLAAAVAALAGTSVNAAMAEWQLDPKESALHFVSIKKGTVGEVHTFRKLEGKVSDDGSASVRIHLDSVDTKVEIRDERMRKMLFETEKYPLATVTARVDAAMLKALKIGERRVVPLEFSLELHGARQTFETQVVVTGLARGALAVTSREPVVVTAADFGLEQGVEALRKVVELPSIAGAVPVTFDLVFRPAAQ